MRSESDTASRRPVEHLECASQGSDHGTGTAVKRTAVGVVSVGRFSKKVAHTDLLTSRTLANPPRKRGAIGVSIKNDNVTQRAALRHPG